MKVGLAKKKIKSREQKPLYNIYGINHLLVYFFFKLSLIIIRNTIFFKKKTTLNRKIKKKIRKNK